MHIASFQMIFYRLSKSPVLNKGERYLRFICNIGCCMKLVVRINSKTFMNLSDDYSSFKNNKKMLKIKALLNCRFTVFLVVDCIFSKFFVDVDFYLKSACRCRLDG